MVHTITISTLQGVQLTGKVLHNISTGFIIFTFDNCCDPFLQKEHCANAASCQWPQSGRTRWLWAERGLHLALEGEKACLRVSSINENGLSTLGKRRELFENFGIGRLDAIGIQKRKKTYRRMWSNGHCDEEQQ